MKKAGEFYNEDISKVENSKVDQSFIPKPVEIQFLFNTGIDIIFYSDKNFIIVKSAKNVLFMRRALKIDHDTERMEWVTYHQLEGHSG